MFSKARRALFGLILLSGLLLPSTFPRGQQIDDDIRIDVPVDGQVRVNNQFGNVTVEVWKKGYVSVSGSIDGSSVRFRRSPIVVENRGKLLSISVVRTPVDPVAAIHVNVKVPESARLEILTAGGSIVMHGLSTSASLKTKAGDIQAVLPTPLDANISARSSRGTVKSELAGPAGDGHVLQARLANATKTLDAQTDTGQILLSSEAGAPPLTSPGASVQPELVGPDNAAKVAGTPESKNENQEISEGDVIRVDSQMVSLNTSVIDRSTSRGLTGLTQSDFRLFEDGREQHIVHFESAAAPFDLVLLIDLSGSTKDVVKLIRAAALRFIDAARPSDRIAVITFAGEATVVSGLTADRAVLRPRIEAIDTARGDTKLYDATEFAMNEIIKDSKKSRRTAVVLMSDGLDGSIPGVNGQRGSQLSYKEIINHIQEFDGVLYTLWLNTEYQSLSPLDTQPEAFDAGHDRMKEMADAGGGMFYEVEHLTDLAGAYEQVVADLGTVYSLAYRPENKSRDGKWRAIRISVGRPDAVARGKRGYYAK